ncbi:Hypothetical predicted protein, partial [Paramuricea clavata]
MDSSIIIEDYFTFPQSSHKENSLRTSTPSKITNLINTGNEFAWKGSTEKLKNLCTNRPKSSRQVDLNNKEQSLAEKFKTFATLIEGEFKGHSDEQHAEAEDTLGMDKTGENISTKKTSIPTHATEYREDLDNSEIEMKSTKYGCDSGKIINSQCHCSELAVQFKRIEHDLKLLKNRIEVRKADETALICRTATCRSEKSYLKSELEVANSKIIDLQAKIKHLENKKSSLTTAIRIIQEDNSLRSNVNTEDDQGGNQWVELNKKKKKRKHDQTHKLQEIPTIATQENCPLETTCADESNATVKKMSRQGRKDGYPNTQGNHQNPVKSMSAASRDEQTCAFLLRCICIICIRLIRNMPPKKRNIATEKTASRIEDKSDVIAEDSHTSDQNDENGPVSYDENRLSNLIFNPLNTSFNKTIDQFTIGSGLDPDFNYYSGAHNCDYYTEDGFSAKLRSQ